MQQKPNIIFDLGNVLIHCDMDKASQEIAKNSTLAPDEIKSRIFAAHVIDPFDSGEHDEERFTEVVREICEWTGSQKELEKIWQEMLVADPEMFGLYEEMLAAGYPIYILSNANPFHTDFVLDENPILHKANGRVFSCECRMIKPQKEIFHHIAEKFSLDPSRSIFIDDKLPNIEAARHVGFYAIHHSATDLTRPQLYNLIAKLSS